MKNRILTLLVILFISANSFAQNKVGYVNVEAVLNSMPSYQAAATKFNNYAETVVTPAIKAKSQEFETRYNKLQQEGANMSETNREVEANELMRMEKEIAQMHKDNKTQEKIAQKQQELFGPVEQEAIELINKVAKANGFALVFNSPQNIVYAAEGTDLLPLIKNELGAN